jgi:hypothetical protein
MQERYRVEILIELMRHQNQRHPSSGLAAAVSASRGLTEQWESWHCFVRGLQGLFRDSPTGEHQTHLQEIIAVAKGMRDVDLRSCTLALIATSCHEYAPVLCDELLQQLPSRYRKRDPAPKGKKGSADGDAHPRDADFLLRDSSGTDTSQGRRANSVRIAAGRDAILSAHCQKIPAETVRYHVFLYTRS